MIALYRPIIIVHLTRKLDGEEISMLRDIVADGQREGIPGGCWWCSRANS